MRRAGFPQSAAAQGGRMRKGTHMLETVDFIREAPEKEEYKARRDELMERLTALQQRARRACGPGGAV